MDGAFWCDQGFKDEHANERGHKPGQTQARGWVLEIHNAPGVGEHAAEKQSEDYVNEEQGRVFVVSEDQGYPLEGVHRLREAVVGIEIHIQGECLSWQGQKQEECNDPIQAPHWVISSELRFNTSFCLSDWALVNAIWASCSSVFFR